VRGDFFVHLNAMAAAEETANAARLLLWQEAQAALGMNSRPLSESAECFPRSLSDRVLAPELSKPATAAH